MTLGKALLNPANPNGIPPRADGMLLNDGQGTDYDFEMGKNYRFRIINMGAASSAMIHFDSHDMNVIMNDAAHVEQQIAYQLHVAPAQRYDVILKCISRDNRNFDFVVSLDQNRDYTKDGATWKTNSTGCLVMDPEGERRPDVVEAWRPFDDAHFKPLGGADILPAADKTLIFNFEHCTDEYG
ncbi:hypothetical protein IMZ48_36650, partial [Candidatus Bathyarchaeota archaeon]|nr:hypothetical protein [Candidatus Bathyarchaeota archaeon]